MLAAATVEELAIGELAELLDESQPNVSRHVAPLRRLGLLAERKQGTRVLVRLADAARRDAVVVDAIEAGRALCEPEATLERIASIVARRDQPAREFFARVTGSEEDIDYPEELPAYLMALAPLMPRRGLAVDVGTGEGRLLDVLAPLFDRVVAVDREPAQLEVARRRAQTRSYENVQLLNVDLLAPEARDELAAVGPADAVFASRILHHAPRPVDTIARLADLLKEGGVLVVLDYAPHDDERMREAQADLWLGFSPDELAGFAAGAGLCDASVRLVPRGFRGSGPDRHLGWQLFTARRAAGRSDSMMNGTMEKSDG
jgi:ArsR family transcriptional regulator